MDDVPDRLAAHGRRARSAGRRSLAAVVDATRIVLVDAETLHPIEFRE